MVPMGRYDFQICFQVRYPVGPLLEMLAVGFICFWAVMDKINVRPNETREKML